MADIEQLQLAPSYVLLLQRPSGSSSVALYKDAARLESFKVHCSS